MTIPGEKMIRKADAVGFSKWMLVAILVLMQMSCAASQHMRREDREAVRTVYMDRNVPLPDPSMQTHGKTTAGVMGGLVGSLIAYAVDKPKEKAMLEYIEKNNIKMDVLLVDAFTKEITTRGVFRIVQSPSEADATVKLEILSYGVAQGDNAFSSTYRAVLNAKATMVKPGGAVIWAKQVTDNANKSDPPEDTLEALYSNPEVMRARMASVAQTAAKAMVDHLSGSP